MNAAAADLAARRPVWLALSALYLDTDVREHYAEAARLSPEDPYWRLNLGAWLVDRARLDEGIAELERSRELFASSPEPLLNAGMASQALWDAYQRKGDAERAYRRAIEVLGGQPDLAEHRGQKAAIEKKLRALGR